MKNSLGRFVPEGFTPFEGSGAFKNKNRIQISKKSVSEGFESLSSVSEMFDKLGITDGMTLSFHHHLRNGDFVLNMVAEEIKRRNLKNMKLAPSSIFPANAILVELIENGNVTEIYTDYVNGPVAEAISRGKLKGMCVMHTHGGRPMAIESGLLHIDVAILAVPAVDKFGNGTGAEGTGACGSLGYAVSDLEYADKVVFVTDTFIDRAENAQLDGRYVDYVLKVDAIGDPKGIVSGTTRITKDPVGLKIARNTVKLLEELGLIEDGLSMQTGAGGTSLAVAHYVRSRMLEKGIKGSFASGGITGYFTDMLEEGLFDELYDVQCFDLKAVQSIAKNPNHHAMSGSRYANPFDDNIVDRLDFVILGATEIDLNFNVNVTTDSHGVIMGGSGGHSDTAYGAKVTVITTNLVKSRLPIIKDRVTTVTTPGEDVDVLVTERGIAINPVRKDLLKKLEGSRLPIVPIEKLLETAHKITGVPAKVEQSDKPVGVVVYRDGTVIDTVFKTN
ncbi:MAG: citrate lyase subunit alpha [Clostridiales bacterium]|nr:citrate lyase subunit alpha [Clostridiales bacterium]